MFENTYTMTDKIIWEYALMIACKKLIVYGITVGMMGALLIWVSMNNSDPLVLGIYIASTIIVILTTILTPFMTFRSFKKSSLNLHGGETFETKLLFKDKIFMSEGKIQMEFEYKNIVKIQKLKSITALMLSKTQGIIVDNNGFKDGDIEKFIEFVHKKIK